ncbi:DEAD/DEAH box helicase family protein [Corynebacterium durum]|jgi:hypothetical protein|uniref:DEAD/DEAH box helicase family protein n=1 Tax=Corynebacterium durum TaxID=61592 RepID=UPI000345131C|nr:DEAD/DEAH box helicase family protein [Corynebacterium durum]
MLPPQPTNFGFIGRIWPELLIHCRDAEQAAVSNPRVAGIEARFVLERLVDHISEAYGLRATHGWNLNDKLNHRSFKDRVNPQIHSKMNVLRRFGNDAAHSADYIDPERAVRAIGQLFDVLSWSTVNVARTPLNHNQLPAFDRSIVINAPKQRNQTQRELTNLNRKLKEAIEEQNATKLLLSEQEEKWRKERERHLKQIAAFQGENEELEKRLTEERTALEAELEQMRAEIAALQAVDTSANFAISEAETRRDLIDPALGEAGFSVERGNLLTEFPIDNGRVDYVLLGDGGTPYALVEAKKTSKSIDAGRQQAEFYADALEKRYGTRPIIYYTNGYEIRLLDDGAQLPGVGGYQPRAVEGYATKDELYAMIRKRSQRQALDAVGVDKHIAGRAYQTIMLQAVAERFGAGHRRSLLVMATGTGKTRTAIALVKKLMQAGWAKNVLFLADRKSLVKQAAESFNQHLENVPVVNLLDNPRGDGQIYFSTYQTMINMLGGEHGAARSFSPYHFDLVIVDEAHRTIYRRYSRIFDYFDSLLLGLTATPRQEVDRNTYRMFNLEDGSPTADYPLNQAIDDGYLVPFKSFQCSSVILREGVVYANLSPEEQLEWENQNWGIDENGDPIEAPEEANSDEINAKLYNKDTIRQVVGQVLKHGIKVAGADRIGKTIFFTRNKKHAELVYEILIETNPQVKAAVITHDAYNSLELIDHFKSSGKDAIDIAISVDMLDTGVDVPSVVNLVFFKPVYSNTKFWQMIGRGTRLAENLFGEGLDKKEFFIFDYCDNLRRFNGTDGIPPTEGSPQRSLSERTFLHRVELVSLLPAGDEVRETVVDKLRSQLESVPRRSVLVRPEDRAGLERFTGADAWQEVDIDVNALNELAYLPFADGPEDEEHAKRFDYLLLSLQLDIAHGDALTERNRDKLTGIAEHLLTKTNVPRVAEAAETLERYSADMWWEGITILELEAARRELRTLVQFMDRGSRNAVVMDVKDELVEPEEFALLTESAGGFRSSVEDRIRDVLEKHQNELAIQRIRKLKPLTAQDVDSLEGIIATAGEETVEEFRDKIDGQSVVGFVRGLIGLDESAVEEAFADLLERSQLSAMQMEFLRRIIRVLSKTGSLTMNQLYDEPFNELGNVVDVFDGNMAIVLDLKTRLEQVNAVG